MRRPLPALLLAVALCSTPALADPVLLGSEWLIESVAGTSPIDSGQTRFLVKDDGSVSTTIGCNRMAGKARIDGDKIALGSLISTRMACAETLMAQEQAYAKALEAARSFRIEGKTLKLIDAAGTVVVALARAP